MLNKKRLVMMAVAASMVLPTNLTYLSMTTSVLATNTPPNNEDENTTPSENDPIEITTASSDGTLNLENGKSYKLKRGITLNLTKQITIPAKAQITLDLNGGTIISPAQNVFLLKEGAFLEVIGSGSTIQSTYPGSVGQIFASCEPDIQLNIGNGITLTASEETDFIYGIGLDSKRNGTSATGAVINVTGVTMNNIQGGVSVNGNMPEDEDTAPLINLTNVVINATTTQSKADSIDPSDDSIGILQSGYSVINVVDCTITSDRLGIETRDGVLNVSGGSISGSTTKHTRVDKNGNGSTTAYAGIAIDQHSYEPNDGYTRPISVNVTNVENITGYIPVVISNTNPSHQTNVPENEIDSNVSIVLSNVKKWTPGEEDGTSLPKVGYTSEKIGFTLVDCGVDEKEIQKYTVTKAPDNSENHSFALATPQPENHPNATLINTNELGLNVTPTSTLTLPQGSLGSSQVNGNLLNETAISSVQEALAQTINDPNSQPTFLNPIDPETGEVASEASGLGYTYTVEVTGAVIKKGNDYILPVALKAQLDKAKSVVRLIIPLNTEQTESAFVEEREVATGEWTDNQFPVDVKLNQILDEAGKIQTDTITKMLAKIPALQGKYDTNAEFEFATFNLNGTYSVADTTSPISFVGTKKVTNTGGTGGSHKPKPKPEQPAEEPVVGTPTTMYRLYNKLTGEHLYTIDKNERDNLLTSDTWKDEGEGWIAPSESAYPVYRLLNPNNSDHHYTMDKNEFDTLPSYGWVAEGVAFFSADKDNPENVLLHRLYNPNAKGAGSHHYTADTNERDTLVAQGWTYEGLAWAGLPANK